MAEYSGDIKLGVSLSTKSVLQSLNSLKKTISDGFSGSSSKRLDKSVQMTNKSIQQMQKEFEKVQTEIKKTEDKMRELQTRYKTIQENGTLNPTKRTNKEYDGKYYSESDYAKLKLLDTQLDNTGARLDELNQKSDTLGSTLSRMEVSPETPAELEDVASSTERATKNTSGFKSAFDGVRSKAQKFATTVLSAMKKVGTAVFSTAKNITVTLGKALTAPFTSIGSKITGIFKKISTSIRRVFVFSVITSALRNIRSTVSSLITSNESLNSSLKQIKSNLWTAFAPIYTKVLPALQALMNALSKATAYAAAFFSALFGNTVSQFYETASDLYNKVNAGDQIDAEIDAIQEKIDALEKEKTAYQKEKEAEEKANKKSLLSFDELNQISAPETDDATLQAYEDQIEALEEQLDLLQKQKDAIEDTTDAAEGLTFPIQAENLYDKVADFVNKLKEAWTKSDFTDIGKTIGDKLTETLDNIDWNSIQTTAENIGKSIATFINGAISPDSFGIIGTTIAEGLNTAIDFVGGIIHSLNWDNLGQSFASMINNIVNAANWQEWGEIFADAFLGATQAITAFVNAFDWKEAGMAIVSFFEGFLGKILGMTEIEWQPLTESISYLFDQLARVGEFVFDALYDFYNAFLVPLGQWVLGEAFPRFVSAIADQLALVDWTVLNEALLNLWNAILPFAEHVGEGLLWFWESVITPFISWAANNLIPAALDLISSAIQLIDQVIQAAMPAIEMLWDNFLTPLIEFTWDVVIDFIKLLTEAFTALSDWASENQETLTTVAEVILGFLAGMWIYNTTKKIIDFIISLANSLITLAGNLSIAGMAGTIANIAFGALGAAILLIVSNWDKMSDMQKVVAILGTLAIAAVAAAAAVGALQSAWSLGIAAAAIVAGIVAIVAACNSAQKDAVSEMSNIEAPTIDVPTFNLPSELTNLPGLAEGAVIPPNREFLAVLGDQKRGTNIEAPLDTIKQAVAEVVGQNGGTSGGDINITFTGNLAQLARVLKPEITRESTRAGSSLIIGGNKA